MHFIPLLIIPLSAAMYHVFSKSLGTKLGNPWALLALTYSLAAMVSVALALALPGFGVVRGADLRSAWPLALLLGLACVGIEGGYLLAYRLGWSVHHLFSITSFLGTIAVCSVGFWYFREPLAGSSLAGVALIVMGAALVHWK